MSAITINPVLDTRRRLKSGKYPVKIRVTWDRASRFFSCSVRGKKITLTEEEWKRVMTSRPRKEYKEIKVMIQAAEAKAQEIVDGMDVFSWEVFSEQFLEKKTDRDNVFWWYEKKMEKCVANQQHGTAENYRNSMNSLQSVMGKKRLYFHEVTVRWLERYERKMRAEGAAVNTIGNYLRSLRHIFNMAMEAGAAEEKRYPFGRHKYIIPQGDAPRKVLQPESVRRFMEYRPEPMSLEHWAKDIFFLSYLWNGVNPADLFRMKYTDIEADGKITFYREKMKERHRQRTEPVIVYIDGLPKEIIDRWGQGGNGYVFDILTPDMDREARRIKVKTATSTINRNLKKIFRKLEIDESVSLNYARHSFATTLFDAGYSESAIAGMMGHSDTTVLKKHYIDKTLTREKAKMVRRDLTPWEEEKASEGERVSDV